jgi:CHAT domain-containing protein
MVDDPAEKLVAFGFEANRDAITGAVLGRYRMIHFATHGIAESELSALVLSRWDRSGQPMSRYLLEEWEIYDMDLAADLVVLSACRSGLGPRARGEGVLGLARAFLWAGATQVVASLWDVDDEATRHLMTEFYRRMLVHGDPPAEALRRAQASVREDSRWRSPHYWAGFVLQGDGS